MSRVKLVDVQEIAHTWAASRSLEDETKWSIHVYYPVNLDQISIDMVVHSKLSVCGFFARVKLSGMFMVQVPNRDELAIHVWREMDKARAWLIEEMDNVD